jgi:hypothetical protein
MEILRDRYVCEGWKLDEEAAARVLRYVRRRPGMRGELQRVECHAQANAESLIAAAWNQTSRPALSAWRRPFRLRLMGALGPGSPDHSTGAFRFRRRPRDGRQKRTGDDEDAPRRAI